MIPPKEDLTLNYYACFPLGPYDLLLWYIGDRYQYCPEYDEVQISRVSRVGQVRFINTNIKQKC